MDPILFYLQFAVAVLGMIYNAIMVHEHLEERRWWKLAGAVLGVVLFAYAIWFKLHHLP